MVVAVVAVEGPEAGRQVGEQVGGGDAQGVQRGLAAGVQQAVVVVDEQLQARLVAEGVGNPGFQPCGLLPERGGETIEHCQGPPGAGYLPPDRAQIGHESVTVLPEQHAVAELGGIGLEAGERAPHLRKYAGLFGPQFLGALPGRLKQILLPFALQKPLGQGVPGGVGVAPPHPVLDTVHGLDLQHGSLLAAHFWPYAVRGRRVVAGRLETNRHWPAGPPASCTAGPPANSRYVPAAPCPGTPGRCRTTRRGPGADRWQPRCRR